jgi:hypothetical protein
MMYKRVASPSRRVIGAIWYAMDRFPEELIERIVAFAFSELPPSYSPWPLRAALLPKSPPMTTTSVKFSSTTFLLVSRQLNRITIPFIYTRIHVQTRSQARLLVGTLHARPDLARCIRWFVARGCWNEVGEALACVGARLEVLELTFDDPPPRHQEIPAVQERGVTLAVIFSRAPSSISPARCWERGVEGQSHFYSVFHHCSCSFAHHVALCYHDPRPTSPKTLNISFSRSLASTAMADAKLRVHGISAVP